MNEETLKEQVYREQKEIAGMRQVNKFWENWEEGCRRARHSVASEPDELIRNAALDVVARLARLNRKNCTLSPHTYNGLISECFSAHASVGDIHGLVHEEAVGQAKKADTLRRAAERHRPDYERLLYVVKEIEALTYDFVQGLTMDEDEVDDVANLVRWAMGYEDFKRHGPSDWEDIKDNFKQYDNRSLIQAMKGE